MQEKVEEPLFYEVWDKSNSYHGGGRIAFVKTLLEAEALQASMDNKWDGCEGSYTIKINPIFEKDFGLEKYKQWLCKHDWRKTIHPFKNGRDITLVKGLYECAKCHDRHRVSKRERGYKGHKNHMLPPYDGIAYLDDNGQIIRPRKKKWIEVPIEELL